MVVLGRDRPPGSISDRSVNTLIGIDAAHIRGMPTAGRTKCRTAWRFAPSTIACSTTGPSQSARIYGCGSRGPWREAQLAVCSMSLMAKRCGCLSTNNSTRAASTSAGTTFKFSRGRCDGGRLQSTKLLRSLFCPSHFRMRSGPTPSMSKRIAIIAAFISPTRSCISRPCAALFFRSSLWCV
jgi:hypothetical protein